MEEAKKNLEKYISELCSDTKLSNIINEIRERKLIGSPSNSESNNQNSADLQTEESHVQEQHNEAAVSLSCLDESDIGPNKKPDMSVLKWDFTVQADEEIPHRNAPEGIEEQEKQLVEDVLNILLGFDGIFIKANALNDPKDRRTFRINGDIHQPLIRMVERLLPVASDYSEVARFVEESVHLSAGRVNQALGSAFSHELMDYMNVVVSFEQVKFLNLNCMWTHLYRVANKLHMMTQVCKFIQSEKARGGSTLSILHSCTANCLADPDAQNMCLDWTKCASKPFFETLEIWLYEGKVFDPYDEFMIAEKPIRHAPVEDDWENKFHIRKQYTPQFLDNLSATILNTGVYMFCISKSLSFHPRVCFADISNTLKTYIGLIEYDSIDYVYLNAIKKTHDSANEILRQLFDIDIRHFTIEDFFLKNIEQDNHTLRKLQFAKSIFCIQYGDMFYNIYENCASELQKPAMKDNFAYLPKLVKMSIESSSVVAQENRNFCSDIDVELERGTLSWQVNSLLNNKTPNDAQEEQTILKTMTLKLNASWPLRMILDKKAMKFYQMIFRHIFYMKYVRKRLSIARIVGSKRKHALKYSMIIFLQTCLTYMTVDTVESMWEVFESNYSNTNNVLDLVKEHKKYIYAVLTGCMLTSAQMFKQLEFLLKVCLNYAEKQDSRCEAEFEGSLTTLLELAYADSRWASLSKTLIPIFDNYIKISIPSTPHCDLVSLSTSERSLRAE